MTLIEKFNAFTPAQREKFYAIKDSAGLNAFLREIGLELADGEKAQTLEYFNTGKLPLPDEELDNVAGGGCGFDPVTHLNRVIQAAAADGRVHHVVEASPGGADYSCAHCRQKYVFAKHMVQKPMCNEITVVYRDCKCYNMACLWNFNELTMYHSYGRIKPMPLLPGMED